MKERRKEGGSEKKRRTEGRQAGRNPRVMMEAEVKGRPEERGWKELGSGVPLGVF